MRRLTFIVLVLLSTTVAFSQDLTKFKLYHPEEDAAKGIEAAVKKAKAEGKYVFVQVGGNWCIWCARFNEFVTNDASIDSLVKDNYVVYHLNYSKENKNPAILEKYRFPQRFGFPVFLILNEKGELLHTQNSAYLEEGKGYSKLEVIDFLKSWSPKAFDPAQYKEQ